MADSGLCCGLYRGTIYLKELGDSAGALLPVGNAEATISQTVTDIAQPNFQSLGGSSCKVSYTESVSIELTLHCTKPENLAIAFLGSSAQLTGAVVTSEVHAVNAKGELIPLVHVHNGTTPLVVTGPTATPTYVLNTDYIVTKAGIIITPASSIPATGANIEITYTYGNNYVVNAQTTSQKEFMLVLDGYNAGEDGDKAVVLKAFKVKLSPTESFALISGQDFASVVLNGEILRDETKLTGSKFFSVEFQV